MSSILDKTFRRRKKGGRRSPRRRNRNQLAELRAFLSRDLIVFISRGREATSYSIFEKLIAYCLVQSVV